MRWEHSFGPEAPDRQGSHAARRRYPGAGARHTDGAVLAVPAGAAFALAVAAGPMLGTARVAGPLVAGCPHPAILTATGAAHADAMATTVSSTDLCREEGRGNPGQDGQGQGQEEREKTSIERVAIGNEGHTWLPSWASVSNWDSRGSGG